MTVVADYYNLLSDFFYAEERTLWFLDPEEVAVYGEDDGDEYVLKTEMKAHMEKYLWNQVDGAAWTFFAKVSRYFGLQPNLTSFVCHPTNATSLPTGNQTSIGATQTARRRTHMEWQKGHKHSEVFYVFGAYMNNMQEEFRKLKAIVGRKGIRFEGTAGLFCSATRVRDEVGMLQAKIEIMLPDLCEVIDIPPDRPEWNPNNEEDMRYAIELAQQNNSVSEE